MRADSAGTRGFSLIELLVVIVIVGIVAATAAVGLRTPVLSYLASVRRAELSDEADTALRFIARDLKSALPNSIRCDTTSAPRRLEFLPIRTGGRYREYPRSDGTGTPLEFGISIASFDVIGAGVANSAMTETATGAAASGTLVVGNLSPTSSNACSAYAGDNSATLSSIDGTTGIVNLSAHTFPGACNLATATLRDFSGTALRNEENKRGAGRFFVIGSPVLYTCGPTGLLRYSGYSASAVGVSPIPGGVPATVAGRVSACELACDRSNARLQTISFLITVTDSGESIELFRQVRVENLP